MDKKIILKKLPKTTLILELIIIGIILSYTLYKYHELLGNGSFESLIGNSLPDDDITGWFAIPVLVLDFFGSLGYILFIIIAVIYFGMIMLSMGWNMWIIKNNKDNKLLMSIVGILPAALLGWKAIRSIIPLLIIRKSIWTAVYMLPAIVILIETIFYTILAKAEETIS